MKLSKTAMVGGATGLLIGAAVMGQTILGVAFAAGPTPTPAAAAAPAVPAAPATAAEAADTETKTGPDTDTVQSGDQSGSQVEATTGAVDTPEVASATDPAETPDAPATKSTAPAAAPAG